MSEVPAFGGNGPRRVWLKAFWGFGPWEDGYLGFTKPGARDRFPGARDRFIDNHQPGDLVLIYGADNELTAALDRRQALGFLEVVPDPITDRERMSEAGLARKIEMGCEDRWTYAVPVRRAWRVTRRIDVKHLAPETYTPSRARVIASMGELVRDHEADAILQLPVVQVSVFGEPPVGEAGAEQQMLEALRPSQGITPSFGKREVEFVDRPSKLYMLRYNGDAAALLGRDRFEVGKKIIVKIGYAADPDVRCSSHNAHLPVAKRPHWTIHRISKAFPSAMPAKEAEDAMKAAFAGAFESLGGEFFLGEEAKLDTAFATASASTAFRIKAVS
uniref:Uncharacterized protein n=1 Tax=Bosea sp. NBC_00436 TaxID=2969620 RepID=A0A9E7ZZ55_9HYPH